MVTTTTFSPIVGAEAAMAAAQRGGTYAAGVRLSNGNGGVRVGGQLTRNAVRPPAAVRSTSGINWDCVATAEEGGNWSFHGTVYSSALGMLNQAIRENTDPSTAARIIAGAGTRAEQVAVAESIVRKHGFRHSWGVLTVRRCA